MERLTHKARYEAGYKLNKGIKEWQAADRLGAYEDTGPAPQEIMGLKERDTAKAPTPSKTGLICQICGERAAFVDRFCGNCGQRFEED